MATQTKNYKLTKPARTDKIDIEVLNKNFDAIDEQLGKSTSFYDIDLRAHVTVDSASSEQQSFDLTEVIDFSAVLDALAAGGTVRVHFVDHMDIIIVESTQDMTAILGDVLQNDIATNISGICYNYTRKNYCTIQLHRYAPSGGSAAKTTFIYDPYPPQSASNNTGVAYYDLDLTSVVTVKSSDNELTDGGDNFDITSIVDAEDLLAAANGGKIVRISFNDGWFPSRIVSVSLTDVYLGGNTNDVLAYLSTIYTNMYTERYAKIVVTVRYVEEAYQVLFRYARDPGGAGVTVEDVIAALPIYNGEVVTE